MKHITSLILGALATVVVGCSDNQKPVNQAVNSSEEVKEVSENKTPDKSNLPSYKVATVYNYPPFASADEHGNSEGFDIDVINAIAKKEGFSVSYIPAEWSEWKQDLNSGKVDIWAAGIAIKEDRKEFSNFTSPYLTYHNVAMLLDNEETKSMDIQNLNQLRLSAEKDTVDYDLAIKIAGNESNVMKLDSTFQGLEQLVQGKIDAIIGNNLVLSNHAQSFPEIKTKFILTDEYQNNNSKLLGFMVKKDRNDLTNTLNKGLEDIKSDGTYDKIVEKWFGENSLQ